MNVTQRYFLAAVFISCLASPLSSAAQTSPGRALTDTLVRRLAIKKQLQQPPNDIEDQFRQNPMRLSSKTNKQLLDVFDRAFDGDQLLDDFKSAFRKKMSPRRAAAVSQWLNQTNGQHISQADRAFYSLQGKRKRVIAMYKMDKNQPSQRRKQLISAISDSSGAAKTSVESSVIILRSVIKALNKLSDQRNFSDSQIDAIVQNFKAQIQAQASQQVTHELMIRYYDLRPVVLQNYLSFLQTDAGRQLYQAVDQSMQAAYQQAADRFLQTVNQTS